MLTFIKSNIFTRLQCFLVETETVDIGSKDTFLTDGIFSKYIFVMYPN